MAYQPKNPFDSIESAQDYLRLLAEELARVLGEVEAEQEFVSGDGSSRHLDALRLVCYKLQRLQQHVGTSRRILNDLRLLRRLFDSNSARTPLAHENTDAVTEQPKPLSL
jgi:hypothetical protein